MSRSYKIPIIKDSPRNHKKSSTYWRRIRSRINQLVRQGEDENIPSHHSIINDYDYSDYSFYCKEDKYKRK